MCTLFSLTQALLFSHVIYSVHHYYDNKREWKIADGKMCSYLLIQETYLHIYKIQLIITYIIITMNNQRFQSSTIWLDRTFPMDSAELLLTGAGSGVKRDWDWDWDWDCDGGCCCCSTTTPYCGQEVGLGLGKTARVRLKEGCVKKEGCWIVVVGC